MVRLGQVYWSYLAVLAASCALAMVLDQLRPKGRRAYKLRGTASNLGTFAIEHLGSMILFSPFLIGAYFELHSNWRIFSLPLSLGTLLGFVLIVDFLSYWWHRASHRVGFLMAIHSTHHQSREMNLSLSARHHFLRPLWEQGYRLPLALLGFPLEVFLLGSLLHAIPQFYSHSSLTGRPPEWIHRLFVSPYHHRLHHGMNPVYLDRNFGTVLSVWDHLFGTAVEESEPVRYGWDERTWHDPWRASWLPLREWWRSARGTPVTKA